MPQGKRLNPSTCSVPAISSMRYAGISGWLGAWPTQTAAEDLAGPGVAIFSQRAIVRMASHSASWSQIERSFPTTSMFELIKMTSCSKKQGWKGISKKLKGSIPHCSRLTARSALHSSLFRWFSDVAPFRDWSAQPRRFVIQRTRCHPCHR